MQTELCFPSVGRDDHKAAEDAFVDALENQMALLTGSAGRGEGEAHLVIRQMVARALSDLMVAMHLARHGYLSQSYNAVRAAYESLDLAQLVIKDADEARRWVNTEEGHKDFAASAVRKRLGRPSFDEMYGHYSELAHPRFKSSRFNTFGKRETGKERLQVLVMVGPTMVDEFPEFWFAIMAIVPTSARLILATAGLIGMGDVSEARWDDAARSTTAALKRMAQIVEFGLKGFGLEEVDGFAAHFDSAARIIDEAHKEFRDPPSPDQPDQPEHQHET
jgi:hypothetical protein